jgi:hypothetical protein
MEVFGFLFYLLLFWLFFSFFLIPCPNYNIILFYFFLIVFASSFFSSLCLQSEAMSLFFYACEVYKDWIQLFVILILFKVHMFTISRFSFNIFLFSFLWFYFLSYFCFSLFSFFVFILPLLPSSDMFFFISNATTGSTSLL